MPAPNLIQPDQAYTWESLVYDLLGCFNLLSFAYPIVSSFNPLSTGTHLYHEFWVWIDYFVDTINDQWRPEINGQSLYYFNLHMSFWSCREWTNDKQNKYENASRYWRGWNCILMGLYVYLILDSPTKPLFSVWISDRQTKIIMKYLTHTHTHTYTHTFNLQNKHRLFELFSPLFSFSLLPL